MTSSWRGVTRRAADEHRGAESFGLTEEQAG